MKPEQSSNNQQVIQLIQNIDWILTYSKDLTLQTFLKDEKGIYACLYHYTVIAELITKIDHTLLEKYDYPWNKLQLIRNVILHDYHTIEMRVIWHTNVEILPELKRILNQILENEFIKVK